MRRSLYIGREPSLQKIFIASALLHLLFIAIAVVPLKSRDKQYKSYFVNIVTPSDLRKSTRPPAKKAVKRKTKKKVAKAKTKTTAKTTTRKKAPPKKGVSLEPEKRVSREIERLKAISALDKLKKKKEKEAAQDKEEEEAVASAIEGIRQKRSMSISATQGDQPSNVMDAYYALIRQTIREEWIHPEFDNYLEVIISFHINKSGEVSSLKTVTSSGNTIFDQSALKAVKKASPLPPPAVEEDFEIRFHNEIDKT